MTSIVCDASVLVKLLLPESDSQRAFAVAETFSIAVPELALVEIANALWVHVHGGTIGLDRALTLFTAFAHFKVATYSDIRAVAARPDDCGNA
jgi:predicted nucleic acid-binding protein